MNDDNVVNLDEIRKQIEANIKDYSSALPKDPWLEKMNDRHYFIHSYGGKPMVTNYVYNVAFGKEIMEFISPQSLEVIYSNQTVQAGNSKVELGKWWIRNADRKQYNTVIFDPSKPREYNNCLNLWEGFAVTPKWGHWKWTLKHIYQILCNSDSVKFKYVIKWFAWAIQNPGQRAEVCVAFKGMKGSGKGFLLSQFVTIFGRHGLQISNREHLTGKFNFHLGTCCYMFADEAYYPGDKQVEGTLKQLITEKQIPIEGKRMNLVIGNNNLHIAMSTNNEWSVPATGDERRFFINKVEDKYAKGQISNLHRELYFSRLFTEMDNGGREAMLYDLLHMELRSWHPRTDIPNTEELTTQIALSRTRLQSAVFAMLEDGIFPGSFSNECYKIGATEFYSYLEGIEPLLSQTSVVRKAKIIKDLGCIKDRTATGNIWFFPTLQEMRGNWDKLFGIVQWNGNKEWQVNKSAYQL